MAIDRFQNTRADLGDPPLHFEVVDVSTADVVFTSFPTAFWVGTGGSLVLIRASDNSEIVLQNVPDGTLVPVRAQGISADTTASDIVAFYEKNWEAG